MLKAETQHMPHTLRYFGVILISPKIQTPRKNDRLNVCIGSSYVADKKRHKTDDKIRLLNKKLNAFSFDHSFVTSLSFSVRHELLRSP